MTTETARVEAFSDGVFAIANTLLINLELACLFAIPLHYASKHIPSPRRELS